MIPRTLIEQYNNGVITAMEAASWLLGNLPAESWQSVLPMLPESVLIVLRDLVAQYPIGDEQCLVWISNSPVPDDEKLRHRACARRNVLALLESLKGLGGK